MWQDLDLFLNVCRCWHLNLNYLFLKTYQQMLHCFITCTLIVNHFLQRIFFYCLCNIQYVNRSCCSQLDACCEHFPPLGTTGPEASVLLTISCVSKSVVTLALGIEELQHGLFFLSWENWSFLDCPVWVVMVPQA